MATLLNKIKSRSIKELMREYAWLGRYTLQYKGEVLWYVIVGLLGTVFSLGGSILSKVIIDTVVGSDSGMIPMVLVFYVLMQLSQIGLHALSGRISAAVNIRVNQQITAQVYDKLLSTDWESLSAYHSGDLLTRIEGDVSTIASGVLGWFPELFTRLLQFVGTLGVILYYSPTLALLALLSAPVMLLMSRYVIKMMRHHNPLTAPTPTHSSTAAYRSGTRTQRWRSTASPFAKTPLCLWSVPWWLCSASCGASRFCSRGLLPLVFWRCSFSWPDLCPPRFPLWPA